MKKCHTQAPAATGAYQHAASAAHDQPGGQAQFGKVSKHAFVFCYVTCELSFYIAIAER